MTQPGQTDKRLPWQQFWAQRSPKHILKIWQNQLS